MPDNFGIKITGFLVNPGRAAAKKFLCGFELLVNFKPRHKADPVVCFLCGFAGV